MHAIDYYPTKDYSPLRPVREGRFSRALLEWSRMRCPARVPRKHAPGGWRPPSGPHYEGSAAICRLDDLLYFPGRIAPLAIPQRPEFAGGDGGAAAHADFVYQRHEPDEKRAATQAPH